MPPKDGSGRERASHRAGSRSELPMSLPPEGEQSNQSMDADPDDSEHARALESLIALLDMEISLDDFGQKLGVASLAKVRVTPNVSQTRLEIPLHSREVP